MGCQLPASRRDRSGGKESHTAILAAPGSRSPGVHPSVADQIVAVVDDDDVDIRPRVEGRTHLVEGLEGVLLVVDVRVLSVHAVHQRLAAGIRLHGEGALPEATGLHLLAVEALDPAHHGLHRVHHGAAEGPVAGQEVDQADGAGSPAAGPPDAWRPPRGGHAPSGRSRWGGRSGRGVGGGGGGGGGGWGWEAKEEQGQECEGKTGNLMGASQLAWYTSRAIALQLFAIAAAICSVSSRASRPAISRS